MIWISLDYFRSSFRDVAFKCCWLVLFHICIIFLEISPLWTLILNNIIFLFKELKNIKKWRLISK
jgi:hypothetical protein